MSINWFDRVIIIKKKVADVQRKEKMHIYMLKTVSFSLSWVKKPFGNIILLPSKNDLNENLEAYFSSTEACVQFKVHFVYTYKLKYNSLTFTCINPNRKHYSTVVHISNLSISATT